MKSPMLAAFVAMLPRLAAEDSLRRVAELQAADSNLKPAPRERLLSSWRQQVEGGSGVEKPTTEQITSRMAAMGIRVVSASAERKQASE